MLNDSGQVAFAAQLQGPSVSAQGKSVLKLGGIGNRSRLWFEEQNVAALIRRFRLRSQPQKHKMPTQPCEP